RQHPGMHDDRPGFAFIPTTVRPALRLAVVTETWPPELNGVALTLARLVGGLRQRGHHVELVRPRQGPVASPGPRDGAAGAPGVDDELLVRPLPVPRYPGLRTGVASARLLAAHWRRQAPDLVHIASEG